MSEKDKFLIYGGKNLDGEIKLQGSKNALLPILAGSILCDGDVELSNCPKLLDVENMIKILEGLGGKIKQNGSKIYIDNSNLNKFAIDENLAKTLRSSIFLLGALIGKFRKAIISFPGGCDIGNRPIDMHISALKSIGVEVKEHHSLLVCDAKKIHSGVVHLDFASVGATENIILATANLAGTTRIVNAAKEPEIKDLQDFLNSMGYDIQGAGSSEIIINGKTKTHSIKYKIMPDRIVAGTYIIGCAMAGGKLALKGVNCHDIENLLSKIAYTGCQTENKNGILIVKSTGKLNALDLIDTQVFPGFPTDLQAQIMAMETISNGTSVICENIFENRFKHAKEYIKMGANIILRDRVAVIKGVDFLSGAPVEASDLRGGAGLVLAGMVAKGYTTVSNIYHIERGYQDIDKVLASVGVNIKRI